MEDIRLGRSLASTVKVVTVNPASNDPIVAANPRRTRLVLSSDGSDVAHVFPGLGQASANFGFTLSTSSPTLILRVEDIGNMVCQAWFGSGLAGAVRITVVDSTLEKE